MAGKALFQSKTFWVNLIALIGMVVTSTGWVIEAQWVQYQAAFLAFINIVLRLYTGEPIEGIVTVKEADDGSKIHI
jgi:hypothetical protein